MCRGGGQAETQPRLEGEAGAQGVKEECQKEDVHQRKDVEQLQAKLKGAYQFHRSGSQSTAARGFLGAGTLRRIEF